MTMHIVTRQVWLGPFFVWTAFIPELEDEDAPFGVDDTEEGAIDALKWQLEDRINEASDA